MHHPWTNTLISSNCIHWGLSCFPPSHFDWQSQMISNLFFTNSDHHPCFCLDAMNTNALVWRSKLSIVWCLSVISNSFSTTLRDHLILQPNWARLSTSLVIPDIPSFLLLPHTFPNAHLPVLFKFYISQKAQYESPFSMRLPWAPQLRALFSSSKESRQFSRSSFRVLVFYQTTLFMYIYFIAC